jgi:hypothetical protein
MGPGVRWSGLVASVSLVAAFALALAGDAGGRTEPVAHIACAPAPPAICTESGRIGVGADGTGYQNTDTVPAQATEEDSLITDTGPIDLMQFDTIWPTVVTAYPHLGRIHNTFVKRLVTCGVMARTAGGTVSDLFDDSLLGESTGSSFNQALLVVCLDAVLTAQRKAAGSARDASAGSCVPAYVSIPILVARTGSRYTVKPDGPTIKAHRPGALTVSCKAAPRSITVRVRTRSRRVKLHQIVGGHFAIGYANPTATGITLHNTFTFR